MGFFENFQQETITFQNFYISEKFSFKKLEFIFLSLLAILWLFLSLNEDLSETPTILK